MSARSLLLGPNTETIGIRIDRTGGVTTGFDYLRIGLSVAVLSWHSVGTSYGTGVDSATMAGPLGSIVRAILPMFFALSGFLVCGSLFRSKSLVVFAMHRVLRLVPALAVEILLSAFLLGPLLTAWPLQAYFSGAEFWTYFLNIVGEIHFQLPGLFLDNPFSGIVNRSLWTIPSELRCYLVLLGLAAFGLIRRRVALTLLIGVAWAGYVVAGYTLGFARHWHEDLYTPGHVLVLAFLAGNLLYIWRDKVGLNRALFAGSVLASWATLSLPELAIYSPLPIAYATVYLGLTSPKKVPILMDGDYSYGLYPIRLSDPAELFALVPRWAVLVGEHPGRAAGVADLCAFFLDAHREAGPWSSQAADCTGRAGAQRSVHGCFAAASPAFPIQCR